MRKALKEARQKAGMTQQQMAEKLKISLRHYVKVGSIYRETHCGHCTHGISKTRKPNDKCSYFEEGI